MALAAASVVTRTGVRRRVVLLSPSWLDPFAPHAHTVPSAFSARLCCPPAAMATTFVRPLTVMGVVRRVVLPSPSCPSLLAPKAATVPLLRSARLCCAPAATITIVVSAGTCTGVVRIAVEPMPSSPAPFKPHAKTAPSDRRARLCAPPAATVVNVPVAAITWTGPCAWGTAVAHLPADVRAKCPHASGGVDGERVRGAGGEGRLRGGRYLTREERESAHKSNKNDHGQPGANGDGTAHRNLHESGSGRRACHSCTLSKEILVVPTANVNREPPRIAENLRRGPRPARYAVSAAAVEVRQNVYGSPAAPPTPPRTQERDTELSGRSAGPRGCTAPPSWPSREPTWHKQAFFR